MESFRLFQAIKSMVQIRISHFTLFIDVVLIKLKLPKPTHGIMMFFHFYNRAPWRFPVIIGA